jgi:hypothetical protein
VLARVLAAHRFIAASLLARFCRLLLHLPLLRLVLLLPLSQLPPLQRLLPLLPLLLCVLPLSYPSAWLQHRLCRVHLVSPDAGQPKGLCQLPHAARLGVAPVQGDDLPGKTGRECRCTVTG